MASLEALHREFGESSILRDFTAEESMALIDLSFLVINVDGEVTGPEIRNLTEEVMELTSDGGSSAGTTLSQRRAEHEERLEDVLRSGENTREFIQERAGLIETRDHRLEALKVLGSLSYSDGLHRDEESIIHEIGDAFGFTSDEIEDALIDGAVDIWDLGDESSVQDVS
jgi:uncharacterized tellurite resistance protein B-like protein